jgi:hypothetical protein
MKCYAWFAELKTAIDLHRQRQTIVKVMFRHKQMTNIDHGNFPIYWILRF